MPAAETRLGVVGEPEGESDAAAWWPGLYAATLPASPWAADSRSLYATSQRGSRTVVVRIDCASGSGSAPPVVLPWPALPEKAHPGKPGSSSLLCLLRTPSGDVPVVAASSPSVPERVCALAGDAAVHALPDATAARAAFAGCKAPPLAGLAWRTLRCAPTPATACVGGAARFESLLIWDVAAADYARASGRGLPLLVMPHGGPHSAFSAAFVPSFAFLAQLGYALLAVNFRGSTGFGEAPLASLPGRVGAADVSDVVQATLAALAQSGCARAAGSGALAPHNAATAAAAATASPLPPLDASRVACIGGSHGGFLGAHLALNPATRPLFRAVVLRNPVTNIATMAGSTDIVDWCVVEALGCDAYPPAALAYAPPPLLSAASLGRMFAASPLALAGHARLPGSAAAPPPACEATAPGDGHEDVVLAGLSLADTPPHAPSAVEAAERLTLVSGRPDAGVAFLLMLGLKDRRVPPSQGFELYHALRSRTPAPAPGAVRLLTFPEDGHALDTPATEGESALAIAHFLAQHV